MPDDLHHANLSSINEADLYQSILAFTRVDRPKAERPHEGYLLDFKKELGDKFIQTVAALANTFGGLVIVGVEDDDHDGRPDNLVGVAAQGELKTTVANIIGSNLVPCPPFEIAQCSLPKDPTKKLCVVRIRATTEICLITTKGVKNPVYVRVEDKSEPADAAALRALLERKRQTQNLGPELAARLDELRHRLRFTAQDSFGGVVESDFFRLLLCPTAHPVLPLDLVLEKQFADLVLDKSLAHLEQNEDAKHQTYRSRDWFGVRFYDPALGHMRRWDLTAHGDVGFFATVKFPMPETEGLWSLYDLVADLIATARLAKQMWQSNGYYGSFRLEAALRMQNLAFAVAKDGFPPLYYKRLGHVTALPLQRETLAIAKSPHSAGDATGDFSYADLDLHLEDIVAGVVNQLLRSLGHSAEIEKLKQAVRPLIK